MITYHDDSLRFWKKNITEDLEMLGAYTQMEKFCALSRFKAKT